jgi:hypothetical protein
MKRYWHSQKYKQANLRRSQKAMRELSKKKARKKVKGRSYRVKPIQFHGRVTINAPNNFSIVNNLDEMLIFYDNILKTAKNKNALILEAKNIELITPDSILYLLSIFEYIKAKYGKFPISGSFPVDPDCKRIFVQSGFPKYFHTRENISYDDSDILTIESSIEVEPLIAKKVVKFARDHLGEVRSKKSKRAYEIIIECMGNTFDHAYHSKSPLPKWYLMAIYNSNINSVKFVFLDGGLGIPKTIRRNHLERLQQFITGVTRKFLSIPAIDDSFLISSALNGEFRSRTEKGYRGKGLPKIKKCAETNEIHELKIISSFGSFDVATLTGVELKRQFMGTLFSWSHVQSGEIE